MNILHIISSGGMYGAEAVILNMSRALNQNGHRSMLGVFSNSANPNLELHESAAKDGIESHVIPCNGQIDRTVVASIRNLAAETKADVVHAHGYKADVYVYFALRNSGTPFVSTCHTWYDNDRIVYLYGVVDRFILRSYSAVVAVSEEVQQRLLDAGVCSAKVNIIKNGIDLRPFDHAPAELKNELGWSGHPLVGLVGRLSVEKGIDIFLRAAARVLPVVPDAKFVVAGDGPDRAELERLIVELGIRNSICMLGRRDDMPSVYASLDLMVSASRREGLPIALLEGMASRRPLLVTAVGAVPTVVQDGVTGLLIPPEDIEALAAQIIELLRNPTEAARLGNAARALIEKEYSAERMTADYLRIYESVTGRQVSSGARA